MRLVLASSILLLVLSAVPAAAQIETPNEWEGLWEITTTTRDCTFGAIVDQSTETLPFCPGESLDLFEGDESGVECTGSIDESGGELVCTGSSPIPGFDCTAEFTAEIEVTVSGTSFSSVVISTISYVGPECNFGPDTCFATTAEGTRVGDLGNECQGVPLDHLSWGAAKSRY